MNKKEFEAQYEIKRACGDMGYSDIIGIDGSDRIYMLALDIHDRETSKKAAEVRVMIFDYDNCEAYDMVDEADSISGDALEYAEYLADSEQFSRELYDYDIEIPERKETEFGIDSCVACGALDRLYINDEYRNLGLGGFLVNSLAKLVKEAFEISLRCVVVFVNPDKCDDKERMRERMMLLLENSGYEQIDNGHYIKDYLESSYLL